MKPPRLSLPFRRASLADQVATALRDAIRRGEWRTVLPSESELACHLGVSRPSVHTALLDLEKEGLVTNGHGRLTRVLSPQRSAHAPPTVYFVTPFSRDIIGAVAAEDPIRLIIRAQLAARGIGWKEIFDARLRKGDPRQRLESLVAEHNPACCLVESSSAFIQRWFENSGLPTLVLGSCHPGVKLPSVDLDYRAIGLHAATRIKRYGHKHIAIILPQNPMGGDVACRDALVRHLGRMDRGLRITQVSVGPDAARLKAELDRILALPRRPSVFFTMRPETSQTVSFHLLRSGWRIPQDISLISRDSHLLFELGAPEIARYRSATLKIARTAFRLVKELMAGHPVPHAPILISPDFISGETLSFPTPGLS